MGFFDGLFGTSKRLDPEDYKEHLVELAKEAKAAEERATFMEEASKLSRRKAAAEAKIKRVSGGSNKMTIWLVGLGCLVLLMIMMKGC